MDHTDPTDIQRRQTISKRAIEVRDTWEGLARILSAKRGKIGRYPIRVRRCYQLARVVEGLASYAWEAPREQLAELEQQLEDLATRADRALVAIGIAGHEPKR
jgi:hypothetical protein